MVKIEIINTLTGQVIKVASAASRSEAEALFKRSARVYGGPVKRNPVGLYVESEGRVVLDCMIWEE